MEPSSCKVWVQAETRVGWVRVKTETRRDSESFRQGKYAFLCDEWSLVLCLCHMNLLSVLRSRDTITQSRQEILYTIKHIRRAGASRVHMLPSPWQENLVLSRAVRASQVTSATLWSTLLKETILIKYFCQKELVYEGICIWKHNIYIHIQMFVWKGVQASKQ